MSQRYTIALNLAGMAPSQYLDMEFDSVVSFNGKGVYFGEDGIFEESGATDNGTQINAWFDTPLHDFGRYEQKSIEAIDVGYEADEGLRVTLYAGEDETYPRSIDLEPHRSGQAQQDGMRTLRKYKYSKARYHKVRVANLYGGDFSVDYLAVAPVFYKRRGR